MSGTVGRWVGFVGSLVLMMMAGFYLSFNVYAVQLKETFEFSQTQVELLASFSVGGIALNIAGSAILDKYGSRACYVTSWLLVTISSILMWLSTYHVHFFKQWSILMYLILFINTAGLAIPVVCAVGVEVVRFPARHTGKIIALYFATVSFGKIYYGVLFEIFFEKQQNLGGLFLVVAVGASIAIVICLIFHSNTTGVSEETARLLTESAVTQRETSVPSTGTDSTNLILPKLTIKQIILSGHVHLIMWPCALQVACGVAVLNNITSIAKSIELEHQEWTVYVMSVGFIISHIAFGITIDHFKTPLVGFIIFLVVNITFGLCMLAALLRLDGVVIYAICVVVSLGTGGFISLIMAVLTSIYGPNNYSLMLGIYDVVMSIIALVVQTVTGKTFDNTLITTNSNGYFCQECFQWSFVLWLSVSATCAAFNSLSIYFFRKRPV